MSEMDLGARVYVLGDRRVGTIERIGEGGFVSVRWHKDYATWEPAWRLRMEGTEHE